MAFSIPFNNFSLFWTHIIKFRLTFKVFSDVDLYIYPVSPSATPRLKSCTQTTQNFSHLDLSVCLIYPHICTYYFRILF